MKIITHDGIREGHGTLHSSADVEIARTEAIPAEIGPFDTLEQRISRIFRRSIRVKPLAYVDGQRTLGHVILKGGSYDPDGGMDTPLAIVRGDVVEVTTYGEQYHI